MGCSVKTLGYHRTMARAVFGPTSAAVKFLDAKIAEQGEDEECIVPEEQLIQLLAQIEERAREQREGADEAAEDGGR